MTEPRHIPNAEELDDLILSCRYGDLEDVVAFVCRFGAAALDDHVDEFGNSCLHMAAANGHQDVVKYLLDNLQKPGSMARPNLPPASNTPLHWAALNHHLQILQLLCPRLTTSQICLLNGRGRSAMSEAMEGLSLNTPLAGSNLEGENVTDEIPIREQCVNYLVEMMKLGEEDEQSCMSTDNPKPNEEQLEEKVKRTSLNDTLPLECLR
ncbi:hypothetical protein O181_004896 [Austropuccinia psidii MF-1]|uniref:Ankyrin repeat protein n=1 Tax=Austropuccinia psidii MF-1 TaxID=1389203 RepID=A0A9Q3BGE0_9BASI|nr:hypothetical protein [Austropuccinia psidii MF-1]